MGKVKRLYVCSGCGRSSSQWAGRCPSCGEWGTVDQEPAAAPARRGGAAVAARTGSLLDQPEERRISVGLSGVDRVLGGGLVPGSVVLLAGPPGIGKSTLLLQLASRLSEAGHPCLLASGEESRPQVASRARRLGIDGTELRFVPGRDLLEIVAAAEADRPKVLIVDSIQTVREPGSASLPGGTAQVRACADALIGVAKETGTAVVLVGHVTKDGDVAGPRTLEHAVDAVLAFEGDHRSGLRVLSSGKNRFGAEGEMAWFEMGSKGLTETDAGPGVAAESEPGSATALVLAGRRGFAVDVQALVVPVDGPARRHVAGLDPRRFNLVAAVTDRAAGLRLLHSELYGAVSGGVRLDDPGVDLAVAAALASSCVGAPTPAGRAFVGEVSLTGMVRPVSGFEQRLQAAVAAGVEVVICPSGPGPPPAHGPPVRLAPVRHIRDALAWAIGPREARDLVTNGR
jgi:DNA repair protein RadA/Sms